MSGLDAPDWLTIPPVGEGVISSENLVPLVANVVQVWGPFYVGSAARIYLENTDSTTDTVTWEVEWSPDGTYGAATFGSTLWQNGDAQLHITEIPVLAPYFYLVVSTNVNTGVEVTWKAYFGPQNKSGVGSIPPQRIAGATTTVAASSSLVETPMILSTGRGFIWGTSLPAAWYVRMQCLTPAGLVLYGGFSMSVSGAAGVEVPLPVGSYSVVIANQTGASGNIAWALTSLP